MLARDGAPLVLLHGLLDCAVGWKHLAGAMDRPCHAVDLAGFGDSDLLGLVSDACGRDHGSIGSTATISGYEQAG